jgi:hypothetical protein
MSLCPEGVEVLGKRRPLPRAYRRFGRARHPGPHYYHVRVLQEDAELARASPMWITRP